MAELEEEFTVNSEYTYRYRKDNWLGTVVVNKRGVIYPIRVFPIENENQRDAVKIIHANYLRAIVWDDIRNNLVCHRPGIPLRKYLSDWIEGGGGRSMIMRYKTEGKTEKNEDIWIYYLAEVARDVIRQLYKFVYDLHKLGHCLMDFNIDNISMNGTIAQIVVGILPSDINARKKDFSNVVALIKNIMEMRNPNEREHHKVQHIPGTISHLIDKIGSLKCEDEKDRKEELDEKDRKEELDEAKFLINHLALVPASDTVNFIQNAFLLLENDKQIAKRVYERVVVKCENWNSSDRFGKIGVEYVNKYYNKQGVRQYDQTGDTETVMSSLLRFVRNLVVHTHTKRHITVETIIMTMFHEEILAIQRSLAEDDAIALSALMPCL